LRGLVRCANCDGSFVGGTADGIRRYRCGRDVGPSARNGKPRQRCDSKIVNADWLEAAAWEQCRAFILNPGKTLEEARKRLRERMARSTGFEDQRRAMLAGLAEKETERERVITLYRKGRIDDAEADRQLDAIARDA